MTHDPFSGPVLTIFRNLTLLPSVSYSPHGHLGSASKRHQRAGEPVEGKAIRTGGETTRRRRRREDMAPPPLVRRRWTHDEAVKLVAATATATARPACSFRASDGARASDGTLMRGRRQPARPPHVKAAAMVAPTAARGLRGTVRPAVATPEPKKSAPLLPVCDEPELKTSRPLTPSDSNHATFGGCTFAALRSPR